MASLFISDVNYSGNQHNSMFLPARITTFPSIKWKRSWSTCHVSGSDILIHVCRIIFWILSIFSHFSQQIYKTNRSRGGYALTELELPPVRPYGRRVSTPSSLLASILNIASFDTYVQLYSQKYSRTTYLLMATWLFSTFVMHGLLIHVANYSKQVEENYYNRLTVSNILK